MKHLTEKELLSELRRRITAALKERQEVKITSDGIIINNSHTMHFEIRSKDFYFKGQIIKRADGECGHPTAIHNKDGCNAIFPQCGCTTPTDLKPAEMPLIQPFPHFPLVSSIEDCDCCICTLIHQQRDADMAWLPAHDSAVAAKAVKEFAEKVLATMPEYSDSDYTAGLINDYGGGNVGWWQDYIRCEVERCNEYWKDRVKDAVEMALAHIRAMAEGKE